MRKYHHITNLLAARADANRSPRLALVPLAGGAIASPAISISAPASVSPPNLSDLNPAACYLAQLQPSGRRSTRARLERVARLFGASIGSFQWHELRYEHVVAVRHKLQEQNASAATVNMTLSALRSVARSAWHLGQMSADAYQGIRDVRGVRTSILPAGRALAQTEIAVLLDACAAEETPGGARDACLIALLASGLRRAECAGLLLEDAAVVRGHLRIMGKGQRERQLPLEAGVERALAGWLQVRGGWPGALLCPVTKNGRIVRRPLSGQSVYLALRRRARLAGLAHISPHDLRRTFVTHLLERGANIATVKELCGHAHINTTSRYHRGGARARKQTIELLSLPWPRPRPKRTPRRARKSRRRRRRKT